MSDSWKERFPSAGVAEIMLERLTRIIGQVESCEFGEARRALRLWSQHLDFTGVPKSVCENTELILNEALSFMKGPPPESDLAIDRVRRAIELWR